jgi:hypothetical protein
MEDTFRSLSKSLAIDPITFWKSHILSSDSNRSSHAVTDPAILSIVFRDESCFLGNTLPFKFFDRLSRRLNRRQNTAKKAARFKDERSCGLDRWQSSASLCPPQRLLPKPLQADVKRYFESRAETTELLRNKVAAIAT